MPKIVDHDRYRKELLSKCFDLFADKGYGSITMRQIAQGLSVSTGTLYHYFPSKQALFLQLIDEVTQQDIIGVKSEWSGLKRIQEKAEVLGKHLANNQDYHVKWMYLMIDFAQQHKDDQEIVNSPVFQRICDRYEEAAYEFIGSKDSVLANFVICLMDGLIFEALWENPAVDIVEQCNLLGKMLTAYLEKHSVASTSKKR